MKKIASILSLFLLLAVACDLKKADVNKLALATTISQLSADGVKLSWTPVPGADHTVIEWKSASGKISGSTTVKENEAFIQPKAMGEILTFNIISMNAQEVLATNIVTLALSDPYARSASTDTILSGDVIIQLVGRALNPPAAWCGLTFDSCTLSDYCDGKVLTMRRSGVEEIYKVTVEGARADRSTYTATFLLRIDAAGVVTYVTKDQAQCVTLDPKHLCSSGRTTTYDNGDFAFVMYSTSSSRSTGVVFKLVYGIRSIKVSKAGGCG